MTELLTQLFSPTVVAALDELVSRRVAAEVERRIQEFSVQTYDKNEACKILKTSRHGLIKLEAGGFLVGTRAGRKVAYTRQALENCLKQMADPHFKLRKPMRETK